METNFFKTIANLQLNGDIQITIRQEENKLVVASLLLNEGCKDNAVKLIPPLILKGNPEELDEGYFANISAPLQTTSQLFLNMDAYLKAQETAQQQSKMQQQNGTKVAKVEDEKTKRYQSAIKKAEELASQGKYREAWAKYPEPLDHPDHSDTIRKRKAELSSHFAPDLFASSTKAEDSQQESEITGSYETGEAEDQDDIDFSNTDEETEE